jgi:Predicted dehydrogenases and related proteins
MRITYATEYDRDQRVRLAAIGCGGHAQRNVLPALQFAPAELIAVCDLDATRAEACARQFGAAAAYNNHRDMLAKARPDAVVIVTDYDEEGRPRYPALAMDALRAGAHAWIEKPPAASVAEVEAMADTERETGKFVGVGFKKMFAPANAKAKALTGRPEFGPVATLTARYPQALPPPERRGDQRAMVGFLDHIVHPYSVIRLLGGPIESVYVERTDATGGSVTSIRFASGAVGSLHLSAGQPGAMPLERTEIVGAGGAAVVVENNLRVTYYRPGSGPEGGYGRAGSFYASAREDDEAATLFWEPEFSLGQLYNKGLFLMGYAPELRYFCERVRENAAPEVGNLDDARELLRVFEAYRRPDGQRYALAEMG